MPNIINRLITNYVSILIIKFQRIEFKRCGENKMML